MTPQHEAAIEAVAMVIHTDGCAVPCAGGDHEPGPSETAVAELIVTALTDLELLVDGDAGEAAAARRRGLVTVDSTDLWLVLGALAAAIEGEWHSRLGRAWADLHAAARKPA